ncbi:Glu/Leu/Phe/Val dehydrogenase dimerization domain-containing protein [Alteromonas sp. ASW11-36]|uniref:Glu/Leu/Phe/Val dehydrogenase dimerization domain-containing protein n=1 Tax=Alteromonas arenosi TaxID=3055817 RepID=A0ABT7SV83_9ALTE|nr:Glu/Leu/Phe/Val dehydrogenase dimerization domain-containing protein [Alteromonas sp. ASW11-36]MDM7860075.1 Glu/Leu/Phe/Val dehydrogenase dimerization domain-containing protein [Alteromonas sp. ASW11-36]
MSVFEHGEFDKHERVAFWNDEKTGLKAIIAVHNTYLGPALGGCRMWPYANSAEALTDVLRLSKGMTYKAAMAELKLGGGKSVILGDPRRIKTADMMESMGRFVESLGGSYYTAEDSGISVDDLHNMAKHSQYIAGINAKYQYTGEPSDGNPAPSTAYGVFVGLQAAVQHKFGTGVNGLTVAIQGLGHVGYRLAAHLHAAGAKLIVTDIYPENTQRAVEEFGATVVAPEQINSVKADVLAPCAMGATINLESIAGIQTSVIAGAANNQLSTEAMGEMLRQKDILYAPDYVINAGGVIDIYHQRFDSSAAAMKSHIERIGDNLSAIFTRADDENKATNEVANTMAEERFKY